MFAIRTIAGASALALLFTGSAHAALTAGQVWQSWKDGAADAGATLAAATESESGGVLTLNGVTLTPEDAEAPLTISDLTLAEQADGSVLVTPGASIGIEKRDGDEHASLKLTHQGLSVIVRESGTAGMAYDIRADQTNLAIDVSTPSDADPDAAESVAGTITIEGLTGTWSDEAPDARDIALKLAAAKVGYDLAIADAEEGMTSAITASTDAPTLDFTMHVPAGYSLDADDTPDRFPQMLADGLAINASASQGGSKSSAKVESEETGAIDFTMEGESGTGQFRLDRDAFLVSADYGGMTMTGNSAQFPVPVTVTMQSLGFKLLSPVLAADAAADFAVVVKLAQFAVNDEAWGLIDPEAKLKHDPLDLVIDLAGKAKVDWLAVVSAEESDQEPPMPAPESLDINDVTLKVAGAHLAADGAFTFDNSMGFPMPKGLANVTLTGATQLIDGLVALGLLPEEEAQGASMMMGMFMKPGNEPDSLTSTIEAKEDGTITVNGMEVPF